MENENVKSTVEEVAPNTDNTKQPEFMAYSINTVNELLSYLATKPYNEVNMMIKVLQENGIPVSKQA